MKFLQRSLTFLLLLSTASASVTWSQTTDRFSSFLKSDFLLLSCPGAQPKNHDNEYAYSGESNGIFYCNPLRLNGALFDYNVLTLESKGELKLVKGESNTGRSLELPFSIYLRRNGKLIAGSCVDGSAYSAIEISDILKYAQKGDELIVEPLNREDWPAKRIVKIGGDGC